MYEPPSDLPDVKPPPVTDSGTITFGSFNNPSKLNENVVRVWCQILCSIPTSRLILKYRWFADRLVSDRFLALFGRFGVNSSRIEVQDWSENRDMLEQYHRVDIALDPFPFTGRMTTFSALELGVPVITLEGETFAGRQTSSYYRHMGMTELIAANRQEYVQLATQLAANTQRLTALRRTLRSQLFESPLCDANLLAHNLQTAFRTMWQSWCASQPQASNESA